MASGPALFASRSFVPSDALSPGLRRSPTGIFQHGWRLAPHVGRQCLRSLGRQVRNPCEPGPRVVGLGWRYEDYRPLPMVQGIVKEALIVPGFFLVVGLMFAWALKGFKGSTERERIARAFGRQP